MKSSAFLGHTVPGLAFFIFLSSHLPCPLSPLAFFFNCVYLDSTGQTDMHLASWDGFALWCGGGDRWIKSHSFQNGELQIEVHSEGPTMH